MTNSMIKQYASAQVKSLIAKAESIKDLKHNLTKGTLRELFVTDALSPFLSSQFSIGSGIIINQRGDQSHQTDIIILNNRLLPPFIVRQKIGIYPAECVVATIEVKSRLTKDELIKAERNASFLTDTIYSESGSFTPTLIQKPLCAVFGYYGTGAKELSVEDEGRRWLDLEERGLKAICLANKFLWLHIEEGWKFINGDRKTGEEIKLFLASIIDNLRFRAQKIEVNLGYMQEWLSTYITETRARGHS